MSATHDDTPVGVPVENPNLLTISGLREIADWLAKHPEIPAMQVLVHGRADMLGSGENPREHLTRFAEATDCRVTEGVSYTDVQLVAQINPRARVTLSASMGSIGGRQRSPEYDYQPITEVCSECGGEPLPTPPTWHHSFAPVCQSCKGAAKQLREPVVAAERKVA